MKIVNILFVIALVAIAGLLVNEQRRNAEGNFREGITFANLEICDNLTIDGVSLTFEGETLVNCDDFPERAQEKCKNSKFFAFKIKDSKAPPKIYQGHFGAYIVLEGTKRYENMTSNMTKTVIFSDHGLGDLFIDSPTGFYVIKYDDSFKNLTRFKIETVFKK